MHYEIAEGKVFTRKAIVLLALMAAGATAFFFRFYLGIGATTNLSDNYPWGLWIVFDLVWIALAGGAFVTAGIVYVFMAERFHALGRPAVWMGFISYNCVVITLLADLGLPWHFYSLALYQPEHSAMYEVSWCVGLYVTILGLEFVPAVFDLFEKHWPATVGGWTRFFALGFVNDMVRRVPWGWLRDTWRKLSPVYTVAALGLFTFLMSHSILFAIFAAAFFAGVVWLTRDSYERFGVPVILIIAAVTFSTMHQSSLGSLFLLMPDKLSPLWWSPIIPILFFLSAVASGMALVMFMDLMISYFFGRPYNWKMLGQMGQVLFGALIVYYGVRLTDVTLRGQLANLGSGHGVRFLIEVIGGGIIPIVLLSTAGLRNNKNLLVTSIVLAMGGVIFNRLNVVLLGMNLPGTMPGGHVPTYYPSLVEWTISISLIAAAVFIYGLGVKLMPILPKAEDSHEAG